MPWEAVPFRRPSHTKRSISIRFESGLWYLQEILICRSKFPTRLFHFYQFTYVLWRKSVDCLICYKQELESDTLFDW